MYVFDCLEYYLIKKPILLSVSHKVQLRSRPFTLRLNMEHCFFRVPEALGGLKDHHFLLFSLSFSLAYELLKKEG